ncbi:MAG: AAA family ATPase [Deltaproteobacteria bacterium]|nr:AAA family ATPase [Deltaproteobacteria bacterium]
MFRPSTPVSSGAFFDRQDELARLLRVVETVVDGAPSWLAILGPRKIGKTSLLLEAQRRSRGKGVHFVLLDSLELGPPTWEIVRRLALRCIDAGLAKKLGVSCEALADNAREYRQALVGAPAFSALPPSLRRVVLDVPEMSLEPTHLPRLLHLVQELGEALNTHFLVAWDEFQALSRLEKGRRGFDIYPLLRSAWQVQDRVTYVVSGSERSLLRSLVSEERAPFFQHFAILELGPFANIDALKLLRDAAPKGRKIPSGVAKQAQSILAGHPFYLQLFGEELTVEPPPYGDTELKAVMQRLLFSRTGRLALHFENEYARLVGRSTALAAILRVLAEGACRVSTLATQVGCATGSAVRYIERLGDAVASREDGRYALDDPTFALWLQWRRPGGSIVPMTLLGDEGEKNVAAELARLGFDLVYQSRASRGAFDLLALRGDRQLAVQVKRSPLPLRFRKRPWARMVADARRQGWQWLVAANLPTGEVYFLDPQKARVGRELRLEQEAIIDNVLAWIDETDA